MLSRLRDALKRVGRTVSERRPVLVRNEDPEYILLMDDDGRLAFEFRPGGPGTVLVQTPLTREQYDRWFDDGPQCTGAIYEQVRRDFPERDVIRVDHAVAERLEKEFHTSNRLRAARHVLQYGANRPAALRVQLAALALAAGDLHELKRHVHNALEDYREVLQQAGDYDEIDPQAPRVSGLDLHTGEITSGAISISPETTPSDVMDEGWTDADVPDPVPETTEVPLTQPLQLGGASFRTTLVFEHEGLAAVHLTTTGGGDVAAWVNANWGDVDRAFRWGKIDLERDGEAPPVIVLRYRY